MTPLPDFYALLTSTPLPDSRQSQTGKGLQSGRRNDNYLYLTSTYFYHSPESTDNQ